MRWCGAMLNMAPDKAADETISFQRASSGRLPAALLYTGRQSGRGASAAPRSLCPLCPSRLLLPALLLFALPPRRRTPSSSLPALFPPDPPPKGLPAIFRQIEDS